MPPARRYRAPTDNESVLADPPRGEWPRLAEQNRRRLDAAAVAVGGLPLPELRRLARREALDAAAEYTFGQSPGTAVPGLSPDAPLIVSGHQPELFHPGVWVKNFALAGTAAAAGGTALNLVADHDTLKSASLRLPTWDDRDPGSVRLPSVPFDATDGESPYETRTVRDPELFRTFADRAAPLWRHWGFEPLLPKVWGCVLGHPAATVGEQFAAVRRCWEQQWGCRNLELPVSRLARTAAFARFVRHVVADQPRFRACYNAAVRDYRAAHGIRSRNHPVPDLADSEAPFWGPPGPDGRRTRPSALELADPSRVRPRALTLTLFARLCLGDLFVHGIGGGKYDEVTDALLRDYFGVEPPRFAVLSATLHLPLPAFPHTAADVRALARRERDLYWNPQRHTASAERLRAEKQALAAAEPADPAARREWYRRLAAVTDRLRPFVADELAAAGGAVAAARREAEANAALRRRDFAWLLYPEETLRPFLQRFLTR